MGGVCLVVFCGSEEFVLCLKLSKVTACFIEPSAFFVVQTGYVCSPQCTEGGEVIPSLLLA